MAARFKKNRANRAWAPHPVQVEYRRGIHILGMLREHRRWNKLRMAGLTLLLSVASNYRWREYTNGMKWSRRAFGVMLSAVFSLAMTLPALCGKCHSAAPNSDCAQDHGGKTKHQSGSSSGYTDCDHCDESPGISATRQMNQGTPELLISLPDSPAAQIHDSNRIAATSAIIPTNSVDGTVQKYIFVGETHPPNSVYRLLTVSLKI